MALFYVVVLFILVQNVSFNLGEVCLSSKHHFVTYGDSITDLGRKSFESSSSGFYRSMVVDGSRLKRDKLIVGAKNHIHFLNSTTLKEIHREEWNTSNFDECLKSKDIPDNYCGNYVTNMNIYKEQLVVCGTGSTKPTYKIISLNNYTSMPGTTVDNSINVCASPNPDHRVTGQITNLGEMIAGTFKDVAGEKSQVVGNYVTEKLSVYGQGLSTYKSIAANTKFVNSFYNHVNGYVYIFFVEAAEENNDVLTPTVGRFCATDNGGPSFLPTMWTTFRKARLNCKYNEEIKCSNLVDIVYDDSKKFFYGAFTMTKKNSLGSAVCGFSLSDVEAAINGNFLEKKSKEWVPVKSNIFNGCELNNKNIEGTDTPEGKEPTNYLDFVTSSFVATHHLMATEVKSNQSVFHFVRPVVKFARIVIDKMYELGTMVTVIDEKGRLLHLYGTYSGEEGKTLSLCVIEEVDTRLQNPNNMIMDEDKRVLYISNDEHVYAYDVDSCHRYKDEQTCLGAHNPRCGWSANINRCISFTEQKTQIGSDWAQNLTKCPERKGFVSSWLPWTSCQQGESGRYCLCRQRKCHSCDVELCGLESLTEVTNCTVNSVEDVNRWLAEGPIDGQWSSWQEWSACGNGACGNDTKIRHRQCNSPAPSNGGSNCLGNNFECTTCPKKKEIFRIFWGVWGAWGDCMKAHEHYYEQTRTRECSKPSQCKGAMTDKRQCVKEGMIWGEWVNCSCYQNVQHRYPIFIAGCKDCPRLKMAEYRICEPVDCPIVNQTAQENSTIRPIIVKPIPNERTHTKLNEGNKFKLKEIVIIVCGIAVSCFIVVFVIIFIKRREKMQTYSPGKRKNKAKKGALLRTDTMEGNEEGGSNASSV